MKDHDDPYGGCQCENCRRLRALPGEDIEFLAGALDGTRKKIPQGDRPSYLTFYASLPQLIPHQEIDEPVHVRSTKILYRRTDKTLKGATVYRYLEPPEFE